MRKLLLASVAVLAFGAMSPAMAQNNNTTAGAAVGGTAGGVTGGTIGFFLGGPIGAVIGGFTGAVIGSQAAVSASTVEYSARNPVDPIYLDDDIEVGYKLGNNVKVYPVEGDDKYGYVYANNRVYIVDMNTHEVVHSPGYVIPERTVAYVKAHPSANLSFKGELAPGAELSGDFQFGDIPDDPSYSYAYIDNRPVLVDRRSHRVVWVE
jgi:hypothetical protein